MLLRLEFLWWLFTGILLAVILFPILEAVSDYRFLWPNVLFVVTFVTLTRYIFLLPHTFLAHRQILKIALMILCIPFVFVLISHLNTFQTFLDENGPEALVGDIPFPRNNHLASYIRSELLLFGVGSVIAAILFAGRMMMSVWRVHNRGTV